MDDEKILTEDSALLAELEEFLTNSTTKEFSDFLSILSEEDIKSIFTDNGEILSEGLKQWVKNKAVQYTQWKDKKNYNNAVKNLEKGFDSKLQKKLSKVETKNNLALAKIENKKISGKLTDEKAAALSSVHNAAKDAAKKQREELELKQKEKKESLENKHKTAQDNLEAQIDNSDSSADKKERKEIRSNIYKEDFSDFELMKILDKKGYEPSMENVNILREDNEVFESLMKEDEMETNPMVTAAEVEKVADDKEAPVGDVTKAEEPLVEPEKVEEVPAEEVKVDDEAATEEAKEEIDALLDTTPVDEVKAEEKEPEVEEEKAEEELSESMKNIFSLIDTLNEEMEKTLSPMETKEEPEKVEEKDVYPADEHEETKEVDVKEKDNEPSIAAVETTNTDVYPADEYKEKDEVAPVEIKEEVDVPENKEENPEVENKDTFCDMTHEEKEEVEPVIVKEEATEELEKVEMDNSDTFPEKDHKEDNDLEPVVVTEEELEKEDDDKKEEKEEEKVEEESDEKEDDDSDEEKKDEAEEELEKEDDDSDDDKEETDDSDDKKEEEKLEESLEVYPDCCHKETVEMEKPEVDLYPECCHKSVKDVVGIVVETAQALKDSGKKVNINTIVEAVEEKLNGEIVLEMQAKEEEKKDSVSYASLREACMLDEGYFTQDSFKRETAEDKVNKLNEQVALLIARENNDPMYNELLKESAYVLRLQETLKDKYSKAAQEKTQEIIK